MAVLLIIILLVIIALVLTNVQFRKHESDHFVWLCAIRGEVDKLKKKTDDAASAIAIATERIDEHQKAIDSASQKIESQAEELLELSKKISVSYASVRNDGSKRYTEEVKQECVNYILNNGTTIRGAAKILDIPESTLRSWMKNKG